MCIPHTTSSVTVRVSSQPVSSSVVVLMVLFFRNTTVLTCAPATEPVRWGSASVIMDTSAMTVANHFLRDFSPVTTLPASMEACV